MCDTCMQPYSDTCMPTYRWYMVAHMTTHTSITHATSYMIAHTRINMFPHTPYMIAHTHLSHTHMYQHDRTHPLHAAIHDHTHIYHTCYIPIILAPVPPATSPSYDHTWHASLSQNFTLLLLWHTAIFCDSDVCHVWWVLHKTYRYLLW